MPFNDTENTWRRECLKEDIKSPVLDMLSLKCFLEDKYVSQSLEFRGEIRITGVIYIYM